LVNEIHQVFVLVTLVVYVMGFHNNDWIPDGAAFETDTEDIEGDCG
jgi:hypothetical protein